MAPPTAVSPVSSSPRSPRRLSDNSSFSVACTPLNSRRSSTGSSSHTMNGGAGLSRIDDLCHATIRLDARKYKTSDFARGLLAALRAFRIPSWLDPLIVPEAVKIHKVSGSLTNVIFFVSYPSLPRTRTLLLRLYGPSSGRLISRPQELHILHVLSSRYGFGPHVYGTLENGRIEEYFDAATLTPANIRDTQISRWIATRMADLHSVDLDEVVGTLIDEGNGREIGLARNMRSWLPIAREVVGLPDFPAGRKKETDLDRFASEWKQYVCWLSIVEETEGESLRVFAHNDVQYGNLLRLNKFKGTPEDRQIMLVDFEYASPNPAAFDIANHFVEWTTDYTAANPERLDPTRYPSKQERRNFYTAYLKQSSLSAPAPAIEQRVTDAEVRKLDRQVQVWSPASHAMWGIWSLIHARPDIESKNLAPEFNYVTYACNRLEAFRREIGRLGC